MGPLRIWKYDLYKTFTSTFQLKRSPLIEERSYQGHIYFTFPGSKGPSSITFKLLKVYFCAG